MAYLSKADLVTHVYPELIDIITRSNDSIVTKAINAGVGECKAYLNRFDLLKIFGTVDVDPTFSDEFLNTLVKDVVIWRLIILANPNINVEISRAAYTDAKKTLEKAMKGDIDPGWPLRTDTLSTTSTPQQNELGGENINNGLDPSGNIGWNSNNKRSNHW